MWEKIEGDWCAREKEERKIKAGVNSKNVQQSLLPQGRLQGEGIVGRGSARLGCLEANDQQF